MSIPLEHDYIGLSQMSSMEKKSSAKLSSSSSSNAPKEENNNNNNKVLNLNLKETELRLGLPGSQSQSPPPPPPNPGTEWKTGHGVSIFGKDLEDIKNIKNFVSGAKRGFCESNFGKGSVSVSGSSVLFSPRSGIINGGLLNNNTKTHTLPQKINGVTATFQENKASPPNQPPAAKAQVVGWPPIRSFRKNTMATTNNTNNVSSKKVGSSNDAVEANANANSCVYVKVSMDGAPYLRKVDLKTYSSYAQLSSALEKMFTCFTIGQCSSHGVPGREGLSASRLMDIVNCSEYVLTYEDKDGDWMLVGDVPWDMFTNSCKRLRIMKGTDAIGLAPRAMEKCKNRD